MGENVIHERKIGSGNSRVAVIRERTKNKKFIKTTFRTLMSTTFHMGVSTQSMVALISNRLGNDNFQKDVTGYFYVTGLYYDNKTFTLQIKVELLKCFHDMRYIVFERSGLFPINVLEFIFLSHF